MAGCTRHKVSFWVATSVRRVSAKFRVSGVAGKKNATKKIVAMDVFERIVGRQVENAVERAAAMKLPTNSQHVLFRVPNNHDKFYYIVIVAFERNHDHDFERDLFGKMGEQCFFINFFQRTRRILDDQPCRRRIYNVGVYEFERLRSNRIRQNP